MYLLKPNWTCLPDELSTKKNVSDEIAHAKIGFYLSLRRVLNSKETPADIGFLDAINDTLQALGIIEKNRTFLANTKEWIK